MPARAVPALLVALLTAAPALLLPACAPGPAPVARAAAPVATVSVQDQAATPAPGALLDVRTPAEFAAGHLPGARNVPLDAILDGTATVPDGPLVVVCASGRRSARAAAVLAAQGRAVTDVVGGTQAWVEAGLPLER